MGQFEAERPPPFGGGSGDLPTVSAWQAPPPGAAARIAPVADVSTFHADELVAERFKIVRFIARGGMGELYEAEDLELHERVALKTIRPAIAQDERAVKRFKREVHLARRVTHQNVCRIFDVFHHRPSPEGGGPSREVVFVTMELLPGETLAERLQRTGRLSATDAQPLVAQMATALTAAHQAGVIHRDFKSSNVILLPSSEQEGMLRAVVTDFGLARQSREGEAEGPSVTATGEVYGTPTYMAPEQVEGAEATTATDIYALGVVMYEMVTGLPPFVGDTPLSTAVKRLREPAPSPRTHVPALDPSWERTILRCLERQPSDRFASAVDVVKALGGEAVAPGLRQRRQRRWRIGLGVAGVAGVALVASFLGSRAARMPDELALSTSTARTITPRRAVAVLGFRNLSGRSEAAWLSTAFSEMLTTELAAGETMRTIPGENVARVKSDLGLAEAESFGKDTLGRIRTSLGTDLVVLGSYVAITDGKIRLDLRLQDAVAGETVATMSDTGSEAELLELMSRTGARLRAKLGISELSADQAAGVRAALPSNPEAARLYAEGLVKLRLFDALVARDLLEKAVAADPANALAHSALAAAWSSLGYDGKARDHAKKAFDLSGTLSREHRLSVEARYSEARREWDKATQTYSTLWNFFPDNLDYGLRLASVQLSAGKGSEALATVDALRKLPLPAAADPRIDIAEAEAAESLSDFKRQQTAAARAAVRAVPQGGRALVARTRLLEGGALQSLGDLKKALAAYDEARRIYTEAGDRGGAAHSLNRVARVLRQQGDLAQATAMYQEALSTYREIGDQRGILGVTTNIANVLRQRGDLDGAQRSYEESLATSRRVGDRSAQAQALHNIGIVLRQQGDLEGAKGLYLKALAIRRELGAKAGIASTLNNLGNVLYDQEDLTAAKKMYEDSLAISREIGDKNGMALALGNIAGVLADQGNLAPATKMYEEALVIRRELGSKSLVANALGTIAHVLEDRGELRRAQKTAEEALAIYQEVGEKRGLASVQFRLGEVLSAQGNLVEARKWHEATLSLRETLGEKGTAAESRVALARVSIHQGILKEAETLARQAAETFRIQKAVDDEAGARGVLAQSLLAQGRIAEARDVMTRAAALSRKSQNRLFRLALAIASARVDAASGKASAARRSLQATIDEATKMGLLGHELEARLALGEVEMTSGAVPAGRARLGGVETDARAKGFELIARRAAPAAQR